MKTQSVLTTAILLLATMFSVYGQKEPILVGIKAGANANNAASHGINLGLGLFEPKSIMGVSAGIYADVPLGGGFYFTPEVMYSQKGFRISEGIDLKIFEFPVPIGVEAVTRMNYLDAATNLKYKFGKGNVQGFLRAGPYMGYALSGKVLTRVNSIIDFNLATLPINPGGSLYDRTEFGATAGAGLEFNAGPGKIFTEVSYQHSFTDFTDVPVVDVGLKNKSIGFSVGFAIPIGGTSNEVFRS